VPYVTKETEIKKLVSFDEELIFSKKITNIIITNIVMKTLILTSKTS
jgi:hypothetical protein